MKWRTSGSTNSRYLVPSPRRLRSPSSTSSIYDKAYEYELLAGKDLLSYRIEQQAQIIEDFYLWYMEAVPPTRNRVKNPGPPSSYLPLYPQVLANFLANPAYARHITVCNRDTYGPPGTRGMTCTRQLAP